MSIRDLIQLASAYPGWLSLGFGALPVMALLMLLFPRVQRYSALCQYLYASLTYLACIPGMCSAVLLAYSLFIARENLLDVNLLVYFLPLLAMGLTLVIIGKQVSFRDLPGFGRLAGLMTLIAVSFALVLFVNKVFIGIFFGGSLWILLGLAVGVFLLLQWALYSLTRGNQSPKRSLSSFLNKP